MTDIYGTPQDDTLNSTSIDGKVFGYEGNDTISGGTMIGGPGADLFMQGFVSYETSTSGVSIRFDQGGNFAGLPSSDAWGDEYMYIYGMYGSNFNDEFLPTDTQNWGYTTNWFDGLGGIDTVNLKYFHHGIHLDLTASYLGQFSLYSIERIVGTPYNDNFIASVERKILDGGAGSDTLSYFETYSDSDTGIRVFGNKISHGDVTDIFSNFENIIGTKNNDYFEIASDAFSADGADGVDTLSFWTSSGPVSAGGNFAYFAGEKQINISNFENFKGSKFSDSLDGTDGNNTFIATPGGDQMNGRDGIDTIIYQDSKNGVLVDLPNYHAESIPNGVWDNNKTFNDTLYEIENVTSTSFADHLIGDDNANYFIANEGNDLLESGAGADALVGGAGADTLDGGDGIDEANYQSENASAIFIDLTTNKNDGAAFGDVLLNIERIVGTKFDDTLIVNDVNTQFVGGDGLDLLDFSQLNAAVNFSFDAENPMSNTFSGVEAFRGTKYADSFTGFGNHSILIGGAGADFFSGSYENETAWYLSSPKAININLVNHTASGGDADGDNLVNIGNITASFHNDILIGGKENNFLQGAYGNDTIYGGEGNDTILGGVDSTGGIGSFVPDDSNQADMIYAGPGDDVVTTHTLDVGSVVYGQAGKDTITVFAGKACGGGDNDVLIGKADGAQLYGDNGNDSLTMFGAGIADGGLGNDTYIIHANNVTIVESSNAGLDEVQTDLAAFSLADNLERLVFTGTGNFTGIGNAQANFIQGGSGNDILLGAAGADTLDGGSGNDAAWYLSSKAAVQVNLPNHSAAGGDANGDVLSNIENLTGSNFNDLLVGDSQNNLLQGAAGNDTIYGGAGNDTILGDVGDTGSFERATASNQADLIYAGPGDDVVTTNTLDLGSIVYGQDGADTISVYSGTAYGGLLNDQLIGKAQGASLFAEAGNDLLTLFAAGKADGGEGSDTFEVRTTEQVRIEDHGTVGTDSVYLFNIANAADVATLRVDNDLYVTSLADAKDGHAESGVVLPNWYGSNSNSIELFIVGNGESLSFTH